MVGAAGLASSFAGFGPPAARASASASSSFSDGEPPLVRRVSLTPDTPARGAFQHCALFKNILVAADGDASARLRVLDVRDWSEKQTIRVGAVSRDENADDVSADDVSGTVPAAVSALAFDGTTIVAATHEGFVHTWRLMARGQKRGYVRLLQPRRVDGVAVTPAHILGEPGSKLLACHARSKRAFVVWELDTGKLRGAFNTDGVARGAPLLLVESCATVLACVHADAPAEEDFSLKEKTKNETETETRNAPKKSRVVAALLDVRTGEGGALRDSAVLTNEGTPSCSAFDGELFVVATSLGFLVAWNLHTGDAPMTNAHAREKKNARAAVAAVALVPGDGDAPARVLSGGADRALMLWDKALRPLARLELGSPVTCWPRRGRGWRSRARRTGSSRLWRWALRRTPSRTPRWRRLEKKTQTRRSRRRLLQTFFKSTRCGTTPGPPRPRTPPSTRSPGACPCGRAPTSPAAKPGVPGPGKETKRKTRLGFRRRARSPVLGVRQRKRRRDRNGKKTRLARNSARWTARAWPATRTCAPRRTARARARTDVRRARGCDGARAEDAPVLALQASDVLLDALPAHALARRAQTRVHRAGARRASAANEAPAPNAAEPKGAATGAAAGSAGREASVSTETCAPAPAPARRALVVESESDESDESDASDLEAEADVVARGRDVGAREVGETAGLEVSSLALNATGDVSDDAAPAHPPWMTAHAPPGVGNVEAGPRRVATEAPPAARAMAVERGSSVESRETLAAGSEASGLEPLDEHDLLYELD